MPVECPSCLLYLQAQPWDLEVAGTSSHFPTLGDTRLWGGCPPEEFKSEMSNGDVLTAVLRALMCRRGRKEGSCSPKSYISPEMMFYVIPEFVSHFCHETIYLEYSYVRTQESKLWVSVCEHMWVCVYEYVCIVSLCVCAHAHLCRPEMNIRCLPQLLSDLIFFIFFACIGKDILVIVNT